MSGREAAQVAEIRCLAGGGGGSSIHSKRAEAGTLARQPRIFGGLGALRSKLRHPVAAGTSIRRGLGRAFSRSLRGACCHQPRSPSPPRCRHRSPEVRRGLERPRPARNQRTWFRQHHMSVAQDKRAATIVGVVSVGGIGSDTRVAESEDSGPCPRERQSDGSGGPSPDVHGPEAHRPLPRSAPRQRLSILCFAAGAKMTERTMRSTALGFEKRERHIDDIIGLHAPPRAGIGAPAAASSTP
jgi:hypothetical protein